MRARVVIIVAVVALVSTFQAHAAITGTVVNAGGQAVAGAKVSAYALELTDAERTRLLSATPEKTPLASTTVDAKGRFSIDSIKDAVVKLTVVAPGYAPTSARAERNDEVGTLALATAEMKQGRITAGGKPVAGATVIWSSDSEIITKTDDQGRYSVPDPSKWGERVTVRHPDYALLVEPARRGPVVSAASAVSADRVLTAGVAVRGRVVAEDGKTPAAGATILADNWPAAMASEDGSFTIARTPAKWSVISARSGGLHATKVGTGGAAELTLKLAKPGSLSGSVREMKNQLPVAGAEIRLRTGTFNAREMYSPVIAITDAKGAFMASGIAPGSYAVFVVQPWYSAMPATVTISPNEKVSRILLTSQLARVTGSVIDEEKRPLSGVKVESVQVSREAMPMAFMMGGGRNVLTAPDGTFLLRVDPDTGDIQVSATRKGYPQAKSASYRLGPGERKSGVVLTIPAGMSVSGRITDRDGKPLSGVSVAASPTTAAPAGQVQRMVFNFGGRERNDDFVKTENDGTFTIRLKEGTYDFNFKREGFAAKTVRAQRVTSTNKPIDATLDPGVEITGRVTRGGAGVEGVNVNVFGEGTMANAETGPDGAFRLTDLTPGGMMLSARKEEEFILINKPITAPAADVALEIPPGGRLTGRVVDKNTKQPVTSFQAGVSTPRGAGGFVMSMPPQLRAFTTDDGSFSMDNVPVGTVQLVVQAPGYTVARVNNVTVEEGKAAPEIEVTMDRGARVTGRVTGPDGSALAGVSVRADAAGGRNPMMMMAIGGRGAGVVTDVNGDYTMETVEPGEKTMMFSRSGYLPVQKTVTVSTSDAKVDAQLTTGLRITGLVVTESGAAVAEAAVMASSAGASEFGGRSTQTDANGNFQLEGLAPGRYNFTASKSSLATGQLRDVDVSSPSPVRIVMKTGGTIYGRVSGLKPEELAAASVFAGNSTGNASAPVEANGNYRIEGAPTGTVRVGARTMQSMTGGKQSPFASVEVAPGAQVQQDIEFKTGTVVRGRITRDGRPVPDVMVGFFPRNAQAQTNARTTADREGYYEVSGLDDATYMVSVTDVQRGIPFTTTYEVRGSSTFNIDMKAGAVRGRVIDAATGTPIAEAVIQLREAESTMSFAMRGGQTDASGNFSIEGVTPGKYYVNAEKEGYGSKVVDFTMGDSAPDVEVKLAKNPGVTLRVVDARDGRLLSARVRVMDAQNRVVSEDFMRPFSSVGAEPMKLALDGGTYRATIMAQGYATQTVQITSPSSPTVGLTPGGSIAIKSSGSSLRRARLMGADGREYNRYGGQAVFMVDPSPGVTVLENIAPGAYTLQILGAGDRVESTGRVTVSEGQRAEVEL